MDEAQAVFTGPGEGPTVQGPVGGPLTFKARGEQTGGALTAFENVIAPGDGPPLHTRPGRPEVLRRAGPRGRDGDRRTAAGHLGPAVAFEA